VCLGLFAAVAPARVNAASYNMSIQSVSAAGGKCVSAPNGQFAEGMHVLIWDCNAFLAQNLAYDDQTQELKFGSNCVGVLGEGKAEDPVGVGKCSGAVTQRWSMIANGDNYQVVGVNSLCLNITNSVIANGTPLDLQPCVPNKAVELWSLYQAGDASTAQAALTAGATQPAAGNNAPGQTASASDPNSSGSGSSSPGGGSSGPSGGGSGPSGGGSGPGGGGSGPGGGGGPGLPGIIPILIGLLTPPPDGDNPLGNLPMPPYPPNTSDPSNMDQPMDPGTTPPSGGTPLTQNACGLSTDGKLVQVNTSMPPLDPSQPTDTGQYCVSGGPRDGQCGTVTLDTNAQTMQFCGNGVCTPPTPAGSPPPPGYSQALFGIPDSSPVLPCPTSTTASNDPMGGLGPPMMDQKTGQPVYRPRPGGAPMASLPIPIPVAIPVPQGLPGKQNPPPNICNPKTSTKPPPNICHPKTANPCAPPKSSPVNLKKKLASNDLAMPMAPKQNGPLKLKPSPGGTQMANANPSTPMDSVPACESKPPYLPWGGHGSASITVARGKPCGIGWHDTGATILDSMSVTSQPSCGSLTPKDQHVIVYTPNPGCKSPNDSFMLSMREHNGGRRATLSVKVSVTIR
jgi:hypothetical protein